MGITYKDVAMVGDGIDSLTGAILKRKALQREKKRDEADDAYRNRALDANAKESERNAAARSEEAASRKAYYDTQNAQGAERNVLLSAEQQAKARVAEKASQHARMQGTLDWLKDGVTKGVIPPDKANQALKQALSKVPPEELEGTPFASIDESFFQAPKADDGKMDFVEDPVTGERFARRGNQTLKSGVNPSKQQQISEEQRRAKLAIEAEEERQAKLAAEAASIESRAKPIRDKIQAGNRYVGPEFMGLGDRQKDLDPLEAELARKRVEMAAQGQPAPAESPTVPTTIPPTQEPAQAQTGAMHGVVKPKTREEVMRLPKGVRFLNPADGKVYIKK